LDSSTPKNILKIHHWLHKVGALPEFAAKRENIIFWRGRIGVFGTTFGVYLSTYLYTIRLSVCLRVHYNNIIRNTVSAAYRLNPRPAERHALQSVYNTCHYAASHNRIPIVVVFVFFFYFFFFFFCLMSKELNWFLYNYIEREDETE